ncbi:SDR family NAD(P)-dependent oxidoreductase [Cohnella fermenti]|uniref:Glucose 1-dehydrogenase n=1 Tax=Cohnella fermenti TaxID=2565925 RepID=A0A4S4C998_9BACL|nr:glucose 1-dehydrogenase [Cohnella fermenti]THF84629.1 glucose 1-dehydrogenase [Cohnella fermenti]
MSGRLEGKIVVITGAGSGIGRCSAQLFAREGASVVVNDVNESRGRETERLIEEEGHQALFIHADVCNPESVQDMVRQAIQHFGRIDVLFNNAGISHVGAIHEVEAEQWDAIMNVNVKGVFLPSKYILPHMMERRSGTVINMSSCVAEIGLARRAAYGATKGAVLALTKAMQVDYAAYGIRVNALVPGTIMTPFVENYLKTSYEDPEAAIAAIKTRQLGGELGRPEDVAYAALYLASDESKFMMGAPLYIDGGATFGKNA